MITDIHCHFGLTVLTICYYDDGRYREKYIEGEKMLFATAELQNEPDYDTRISILHSMIGDET
jgi:hypothetical protein